MIVGPKGLLPRNFSNMWVFSSACGSVAIKQLIEITAKVIEINNLVPI